LFLESLEIREVPAVIAWINPLGGDWDNPLNWLGGKIPGAGDTALIGTIIPAQSYTVTHTAATADSVAKVLSSQNLSISAGSLAIGASSVVNALDLSGGALSGPGDLTTNSLFTWTGGALNGGLTLNANGGISMSGLSAKTLDGSTINNSGTAYWSSGTVNAIAQGIFNNLAGADFTAYSNGAFHAVVNNAGIFTKSGTSTILIDTLNNSGNASLLGGTLQTDTFTQDSGTTSFGSHTLSTKNATWTGGTLTGSGGKLNVAGNWVINGAAPLTLDGITINNGGVASWTAGDINTIGGSAFNNLTGAVFTSSSDATFHTTFYNAGTFDLAGSAITNIDTLNNSGAVALQSGTLNVGNYSQRAGGTDLGINTLNATNVDWSGGAFQNNGQLNVSGSLLIHGSPLKILDSTINNSGTATWASGNIGTVGGGTFNNLSGATFTNLTNGTFHPTFNNAGTLTVNGGGVTNIDTLNNAGTVTLQNGTLNLGNFNQFAGTTDLVGQTLTANNMAWSGGVIQKGQIDAVNSLLLAGASPMSLDNATLNNQGSADWISGDIGSAGGSTFNNLSGASFTASSDATFNTTFDNPGTFTLVGSAVTDINTMNNSGTVDLQTGTLDAGTYTQSAGQTALGGNTFNVKDMTWNGGAIQGGGQLNAGNSLVITGPAYKSLDAGTINNFGTTTWTGGNVDSSGGGVFNNQIGASFSAQTGAAFHATLNNAGVLGVNAGTAPAIDTVNNSNVVSFNGAGLNTGLYVQTAGKTHLGGHALNASNPVQLLGGGLFDGGTVSADLMNGAQITIGGTGTLTVNGTYTQMSTGALNLAIAGPNSGQFNQLIASGTAILGGNLNVTFVNGFTARQQDSFPLVGAGAIPTPFATVTINKGGSIPLEMIYSAHTAALAPVPPPLPTYSGPPITSSFGSGLGYLLRSSTFVSGGLPTAKAVDDIFRSLALGIGGTTSGESASAESTSRFDRSFLAGSLHGAGDLSMVESGADDDLVAALLSAASALDGSSDNDVLSGFSIGSRLLTGYQPQPKADILTQKGSRAASVATLTSDDAGELSTARTDGGGDDDLPLEHFLIDPVRRERPVASTPATVSQSSSSD
jgi:hypothetical protein